MKSHLLLIAFIICGLFVSPFESLASICAPPTTTVVLALENGNVTQGFVKDKSIDLNSCKVTDEVFTTLETESDKASKYLNPITGGLNSMTTDPLSGVYEATLDCFPRVINSNGEINRWDCSLRGQVDKLSDSPNDIEAIQAEYQRESEERLAEYHRAMFLYQAIVGTVLFVSAMWPWILLRIKHFSNRGKGFVLFKAIIIQIPVWIFCSLMFSGYGPSPQNQIIRYALNLLPLLVSVEFIWLILIAIRSCFKKTTRNL